MKNRAIAGSNLARFDKRRHNVRHMNLERRHNAMSSATDLLSSIRASESGLTLAALLTAHPHIARRTAQRLIARLIESGQIAARGEGRARRYFLANAQPGSRVLATRVDRFPSFIPLSADSQDILAYIDQPPQARKPVGYQRDFLDAYRPNETWYLSDSLRRQLHKTGRTNDIDKPAGEKVKDTHFV